MKIYYVQCLTSKLILANKIANKEREERERKKIIQFCGAMITAAIYELFFFYSSSSLPLAKASPNSVSPFFGIRALCYAFESRKKNSFGRSSTIEYWIERVHTHTHIHTTYRINSKYQKKKRQEKRNIFKITTTTTSYSVMKCISTWNERVEPPGIKSCFCISLLCSHYDYDRSSICD